MTPATWTRDISPDIERFLAEFQRRASDPAAEDGSLLNDPFLAIDPLRASVVSRELFVQVVPHRKAMFEAAGVGPSRLVEAWQLELDDRHALVRTAWEAPRAGSGPLRLESSFLVARVDGVVTILAYLNHKDLARLLSDESAADEETLQ